MPESPTPVPIQQNQSRRRAAGSGRRSHNPAVAQYLGLGSTDEPTHLEKYAPLPPVRESPPPRPVRKRRRLAAGDNLLGDTRIDPRASDIPEQQSVSEISRVTRSARKSVLLKSKAATNVIPQPESLTTMDHQASIASEITYAGHAGKILQDDSRADPAAPSALLSSRETVSGSHAEDLTMRCNDDSDFAVDDFDFDISDEELLMLASETDKLYSDTTDNLSSSLPETSGRKDQKGYLGTPAASCPLRSFSKFVSPITLKTRLLAATNDSGSIKAQKPIVRPSFPEPVRDRSPIIGLSSNTRLRTCFRIGEVINQSFQAAKSGHHIIVELYARVLASERTGSEHKFTLCDLFHAKPPYIKGVYTAAIWKPVQLFEYDGRRLLQQGRMCRCIGTMKRDGKDWTMTVLNIWEATWEDIEWVEGIVSA